MFENPYYVRNLTWLVATFVLVPLCAVAEAQENYIPYVLESNPHAHQPSRSTVRIREQATGALQSQTFAAQPTKVVLQNPQSPAYTNEMRQQPVSQQDPSIDYSALGNQMGLTGRHPNPSHIARYPGGHPGQPAPQPMPQNQVNQAPPAEPSYVRAAYRRAMGIATPTSSSLARRPVVSETDWLQRLELETQDYQPRERIQPRAAVPVRQPVRTKAQKTQKTATSAKSSLVSDNMLRALVCFCLFLIALAGGYVLIRSRAVASGLDLSELEQNGKLNLLQVLPLAGGTSLVVVEGYEKRFLVALDGAGIKSVEAIGAAGDDPMILKMKRDDGRDRSKGSRRGRSKRRDSRSDMEEIEATPEMDQHLIKMLLQKENKAA